MNREILFKAKRRDNGKWVEGYYCKLDETTYCISEDYERHPVPTHHYILYETMTDWGLPNRFLQFEIDPDTLCQYIGLTDKNGQKIWENDIAHIRSSGLSGYGVVKYQNGNLVLVDEKRKRTYSLYGEWKIRKDGNIFDNADLLEVE